jgi:type IV pilus assembly protein PilY1
MNFKHWILLSLVVVSTLIIGQASTAPGLLNIAQAPLFARASLPPLNMLVMGKDHKIYYEAYNDASDLTGDGVPEVGYQGWRPKADGTPGFLIDYFGYFNSFACYTWDGNKFNPSSASASKTCGGTAWSGDFLNYLTMSRMDALRRVLYGGKRQTDTATETVLQGAFFPQDAHSWGKEYQSTTRDGYNISDYAPLSQPATGTYHLFAVTTLSDNSAPVFRVLRNSTSRIWNWLSIEGPVAGNKCFSSGNARIDCAGTRNDYAVRVSVCPDDAALRDSTCKAYPNGKYKPTGILHDYGETERMYFGLIMGSQQNNLEGGKLRRNVSNFSGEIVANTGQFRTDVNGIARSIDRLRMIGGAYQGGGTTQTGDSNWNWGNANGNCAGTGDVISNGTCRMWGNPIAEMMYESLRYFAGAESATPRFATGGSANGTAEETSMGLTTETWKDPYKAVAQGGLGYDTCANPYQTVISDINPSYDGDLPGSGFAGAVTSTGTTPASIGGFSASVQGQEIWNHEYGSTRRVFIGEVAGATDGAPTSKFANSFGNIRGLAPEEPTKGGTYYSASVARYGRITDINAALYQQKMSTYSIALASPLPRIEIPVGAAGQKITLVPFAKTVSGTFGGGTRKPTNTIVDFYIQELKNFPGQLVDGNVNGGLAKAVFRINYEDVEQGNDHDMDTIARYEVSAKADGTVDVQVISEYAAGSANQYMGYVLSGSNQDGIYLEICDLKDGTGNPSNSTSKTLCASNNTVYRFNTPPGRNPGYCDTASPPADCAGLPPTSNVRNFTPGTTSALQLMDPLWYAAKYGGFNDVNGNGLPETTEWDADSDGTPDNYFLVTNPLNLRSQLTKAFDAIQNQAGASGSIGLAGARVNADSFALLPSYNSLANGHDWIGDLKAFNLTSSGLIGTERWSAAARMPNTPAAVAARKIFTAISNVNSANRTTAVQPFEAGNLGTDPAQIFGRLGYTLTQVTNIFGGSTTPDQMVKYLRGERDLEGGVKDITPFRTRTAILGDIINSAPVIATKRANYGWASASGLTAAQRSAYTSYVAAKSTRTEFSFVGANDGMLHAFNNLGDETFAYIPNGVLNFTGLLADPDYTHRYYVDGNLTLSDVLIGGGWETVLVGGAGAGGRSVFGINVSDPNSFAADDVLWEVNSLTDADMGYVMGKPVVVPTDNGRWVAIFGNGYNSQNGDPVLFVVDVATGQVIRKLAPADGDNINPNGLGNVTAVDTDSDGLVDTVYGGDLLGNVWKFDIGAAAETGWNVALGGTPLFVAKDSAGLRQPITGGFEVAVGPGAGYMLYFGTGRYFVSGDNASSLGQQVQSLYGVWDNGTALTTSRSGLVAQQITSSIETVSPSGEKQIVRSTSRNPVSYQANRGWYLDLVVAGRDTGERFIARPRLQSGKVYFPSYQPGFSTDCAPGGTNLEYALDPLSGGAALGQVSIIPDGVVGDGNTGAISTGGGAPNQNSGVTQSQPQPTLYCDPSDPTCDKYCPITDPDYPCDDDPPPTSCSEVIIVPSAPDKPIIVQRACGRQSWRQLL